MILSRFVMPIVLAASAASGGIAADRIIDPDRSKKIMRVDDTPQMIVEGARTRLATINRIEQVTLRSGNMQYEIRGKDRDGKLVVLRLDPEGGILGVVN